MTMSQTKKIRVVVDTNVFVDAWFREDQDSKDILDLFRTREINLLFSKNTIGELFYIIKSFTKTNLKDSDALQVLERLTYMFYYGKSVNTKNVRVRPSKDPDDDMLYKVAVKGKADYLVTNDRANGLHKRSNSKLQILTTRQFIKQWQEDS